MKTWAGWAEKPVGWWEADTSGDPLNTCIVMKMPGGTTIISLPMPEQIANNLCVFHNSFAFPGHFAEEGGD